MSAIVFDLDGTLWDTCEACAIGWNTVASRLGIDRRVTEDDVRRVAGRSHEDCIRSVYQGLPEETIAALAYETQIEDNRIVGERGGRLYPGVAETIPALAAHHDLYIVSNCQDGYIETFLALTGFGPYFRDFECWGRTRDPKFVNVQRILERNDLQGAVFVGDTEGDAEAAAQAGLPFLWASWGFGQPNSRAWTLRSIEELLRWSRQDLFQSPEIIAQVS